MGQSRSQSQDHLFELSKDPVTAGHEQMCAGQIRAHGFLYTYLWSPYLTGVSLDSGMRIDEKDLLGVTPLMYCAMHGHRKSLRGLLAMGADVRVEYIGGKTALDLAVQEMNVECALLLLRHDSTLKLPEKQPYQALRGLIYLKRSLPVDLLRVLRLYLL